ncbi:phage tail tube protein [Oceanobacillus sojae]|uniref:phage tail tube protein n=1 Tax=Oceanobacillus sojae TaxID=582851 RepID=UPI0021A43CC5|nr:phage tail protein [Oceanobacillus sojae]MCT1904118.1 phage tail protein [Oceanobacillus sojae]
MARLKNAERQHFVQAYKPGESEPGEEWLELAKYISSIGDDTQEGTEEEAFYDGDGTPETSVISVAEAYTPEGYYDPEDDAQELIAGLKRKTGDGRKIWHKVVRSDGKKEWVGRATVSAIVAGAGDASAYETFSCNIRFDQIPKETDLPNGGDNGGNDGGSSGE